MYDYHVNGKQAEFSSFAKKLGWKGVVNLFLPEDLTGPGDCGGVLIRERNVNVIRKEVDKFRRVVRIVAVSGGGTELNRQLFSMSGIDMVSGISSGPELDYVMCRLARENGVAIEFSFIDLLQSYGRSRTMVLSNMRSNAALVRKQGAPFIITSGALSKWDMRSPHDLSVFGRMLGFSDPAIRESLSGRLLEDNEKKMSGSKMGKHLEKL